MLGLSKPISGTGVSGPERLRYPAAQSHSTSAEAQQLKTISDYQSWLAKFPIANPTLPFNLLFRPCAKTSAGKISRRAFVAFTRSSAVADHMVKSEKTTDAKRNARADMKAKKSRPQTLNTQARSRAKHPGYRGS